MNWLILALLTFLFWGISTLFAKLASLYADPTSVLFYEVIGIIISSMFIFFINKLKPSTNIKGIIFGLLIGLVSIFGFYFFILALKAGKTSLVVVITALNPIIPILFSILFLKEALNIKQMIGILLTLLGVLFISI